MTEQESEPLTQEETLDGVRLLRLNRPEKRNPLTTEMGWALVDGVARAMGDPEVRVVAITGAGGAFSSGADLTPRKPTDPAPATIEETGDMVVRLVRGLRFECTKPVVAGIDGIAIGAGLALAMCADIRVASTAARLHPGYTRVATSPDCGLTWTLPAVVGHERAMRFLLEQETLDADAALAVGLVGSVLDADGFEEAFVAYCARLAEVAPFAAMESKRLINQAHPFADLDDHLRDELTTAGRGLRTDDGKEARRALREKRKPIFTGRDRP